MLKFFRQLRQKLIEKGQVRKYLLYAIGEILLVTIGILLALQVNNSNENRKSKIFEQLLLTELHRTIKADFETIEKTIQGNERAQHSCNSLIAHFDAGLPFHDSLAIHFAYATEWWLLTMDENAYRNAESYGLHFLKNASLQKVLNYIYDSRIPYYRDVLSRNSQFHYNTIEPFIFELFEPSERIGYSTSFKRIPINYESLSNSIKYRNVLKTSIRDREKENIIIRQILDLMQQAEQTLEMEISQK